MRLCILWLVALIFATESILANDGPMVAGFDRFAPHQEINTLAAGRLLLGELSCTACHASSDASLAAKNGPRLEGVASRLNLDWIVHFVAAPHKLKPGSTMPDVMGNRDANERAEIALALTAFLSTKLQPPIEIKGSGLLPVPHEFWNKGEPERGRAIYHQVGCVACHEPDKQAATTSTTSPVDRLIENLEPDEIAELGLTGAARAIRSVPLGDLKAKYTRAGLTHFLLDPAQFRPNSRMPTLKLTPMEAADVAAYLLTEQQFPSQVTIAKPSDIERGRKWFMELKCVQCHSIGDTQPRAIAKPLGELDTSRKDHCLTTKSKVNYRLDNAQITTIDAAVAAAKKQEPISAMELLELNLLAYNCYACHERDGRGGLARFRRDHFETVAKVDLGDEGRLPPPLTGVGRKLQTGWLKNVLLGKKTDVRPHMQIRMPVFHAELANRLPELFRSEDKADERNEVDVFGDTRELLDDGRQLMDVGCVQCHSFGGSALPGVIGVDVRGVRDRVRPQWFREFLLNPNRIKSRTRMPSFFPDGKSQRPDLLDGDVDRQIAAMWAYLNAKGNVELPDKIKSARAQNYELRPTDKPIVLRTFMHEAGTHAIAVGFPQQIHFAFNAEKLRLAVGWRGKFLDAQGTWFVRFSPPAEPLGEQVATFPTGVPLAQLSSVAEAWPTNSDSYRFSGYRLDSAGVPTFMYRFADIEVEDRIEPRDLKGLRRMLTLRTQQTVGVTKIWLLAERGKQLTLSGDQACTNEDGLTVTLKDRTGEKRTSAGRDEWLVPIEFEKSCTAEMQYQW